MSYRDQYNITHYRVSKRDVEDAEMVMSASNISGVALSFTKIIALVRAEAEAQKKSWSWAHAHPLVLVYLDKIASLTGETHLLGENVQLAYDWVLANGKGLCRVGE